MFVVRKKKKKKLSQTVFNYFSLLQVSPKFDMKTFHSELYETTPTRISHVQQALKKTANEKRMRNLLIPGATDIFQMVKRFYFLHICVLFYAVGCCKLHIHLVTLVNQNWSLCSGESCSYILFVFAFNLLFLTAPLVEPEITIVDPEEYFVVGGIFHFDLYLVPQLTAKSNRFTYIHSKHTLILVMLDNDKFFYLNQLKEIKSLFYLDL